MDSFLQQVTGLLTNPPGNLIVHLVLAFAIAAALQGVLISRRAGYTETSGRALFGLSLLLAGQVGLFLASGLAWQGLANPHVFLPPLDRAITLFNLTWIIWLWAYPQPARLADSLAGIASLVLVFAFFVSYNQWNAQSAAQPFNGSPVDQIWMLVALAVLVAGSLALLVRRPAGWGLGLGFVLLNLAGHSVQFLWPAAAGDFSGVIRLAQLCSFPLLPALAQRALTGPQTAAAADKAIRPRAVPGNSSQPEQPEGGLLRDRRRYSAAPRTVQAWLQLAVQPDPSQTPAALTRAVAQTMLADICFLVTLNESRGELVFEPGFDAIRENFIPAQAFPRERVPSISSALQRGRPLRLEPGSITPDLRTLCERFGLQDLGGLLLIPLATLSSSVGGFLLLTPYSGRTWTSEDQGYFAMSLEPLVQILQRSRVQAASGENSAAASLELERMRLELENIRRETQQLQAERENLRRKSAVPDVEALMLLQREAQDSIAALQEENQTLHESLQALSSAPAASASSEMGQYELEMRQTLQEVAHLQNRLAEANAQIVTLERQAGRPGLTASEEHEVIVSIAQELRQPMASVTGYTELMLSESVGPLGALQRQFLERVRISIERMRGMLDDFVRFAAQPGAKLGLEERTVRIDSAIDQAIAETRAQFQEKNILLQVDIPEELPDLVADRDAFVQILVSLLQNAGLATPPEGAISLKVQIDGGQAAAPYLLVQVTDSGGGIPAEELPAVFSRRYRADTPPVQGVGDSGLGLSIAKALTEAHGGRIWVECEAGKSATFSVVLPVHSHSLPAHLEASA